MSCGESNSIGGANTNPVGRNGRGSGRVGQAALGGSSEAGLFMYISVYMYIYIYKYTLKSQMYAYTRAVVHWAS